MNVEYRRGTLFTTGNGRKGRYDLSYSSYLYFREKGWPIPPEAEAIVQAKLNPPEPDLSRLHWKTPPWPHQTAGVSKWLKLKRGALYHTMGAGKSMEALTAVGFLMETGKVNRVLITCPLSVYTEWPRQFNRHATAGNIHVLHDVKKAKKFLADLPNYSIVVVNYDKLKSLEADLTGRFDAIVCDEAAKVKNPQAQRTKILARLTKNVEYVLIMTGTPVSKNLIDVYGEYLVMDPFWFGRSFWIFRQRYCRMGGWMGHQIIGYQREAELRQIIDIPSHRVTKQEALPFLPPRSYQERVGEMTPEQKKVYKETKKKYLVELANGTIDIKNAASRIVKLQEIASGFVITEEGETVDLSNVKIDLIKDCLEEMDEEERVTIWSRFKHDLKRSQALVAEHFGERPCFVLSGDVPSRDREALLEGYRSSPGSVLLAQIQTGGIGIDLTCCSKSIVVSNVFDFALYEQMQDRHHRPGQNNPVMYFSLIMENTVDRKIQQVLQNRKDLSNWLMESRGHLSDLFEA